MPWTANISTISESTAGLAVAVVFINEVAGRKEGRTLIVPRSTTPDQLKDRLRSEISELDAASSFLATVAVGPVDLVADAKPGDPEADAFRLGLARIQRLDRLAALGLTVKVDADGLRASLQAALDAHPEYEALL